MGQGFAAVKIIPSLQVRSGLDVYAKEPGANGTEFEDAARGTQPELDRNRILQVPPRPTL